MSRKPTITPAIIEALPLKLDFPLTLDYYEPPRRFRVYSNAYEKALAKLLEENRLLIGRQMEAEVQRLFYGQP